MKRIIPVTIPLESDGSLCDVINDFINKMQEVTGGDVDVQCDLQGNITIYYENNIKTKIETRPLYDIETLYRNDYKINDSSDSAMKNNESGYDSRRNYKPIIL
jgi:hypothetical protein